MFEDAVSDVVNTKMTLAKFLDIDVDKFPPETGYKKVNRSSVPKSQVLYSLTARTAHQLRKWYLESVVDSARRLGIDRWMAKGKKLPPLNSGLEEHLSDGYQDEFMELEKCLDIDLSCWKR
jgi:hypothetical protein